MRQPKLNSALFLNMVARDTYIFLEANMACKCVAVVSSSLLIVSYCNAGESLGGSPDLGFLATILEG